MNRAHLAARNFRLSPGSRRVSVGRRAGHPPPRRRPREGDARKRTMAALRPRDLADAIRFLSIDAIERVGEGHPGTPLGAADTVTALFTRHLKFLARDP